MRMRRAGAGAAAVWWGMAAASAYLATAMFALPDGRPALLFDGFAPPPRYNWVRPPEPLARGNVQPSPVSGSLSVVQPVDASGVALTTPRTQSGSVGTPDGQATILFPQDGFAARLGELSVSVTLTPLDPEALGPSLGALRFDGNAYRIEAHHAPSRTPAQLQKRATVYLRYASGATALLQLVGEEWRTIESVHYPGSNALTAEVSDLGLFVPAAPKDLPYVQRTPWWAYGIVVLLLLPPVVILAWAVYKGRRG